MATQYFEFITNKIAAAKRQADSLASGISHPGLAGEIRELAARQCIEPFLTQSYSCGTGKVIDSRQNLSDQIDLLVYHKKVVPPILISRDLGLFPVECVRYVFEVKSTLTAEDIRDANKKFRSIQRLLSFPRAQPDGSVRGGGLPSTVLFAFRSDISGSELDRYRKYTDQNPPCSVICVLGKGYWFYHAEKKSWYGQDTPPPLPVHTEFAMFITGFMNTLAGEETSLRPFRAGTYVNVDETILNPIPPAANAAE